LVPGALGLAEVLHVSVSNFALRRSRVFVNHDGLLRVATSKRSA
jgi:hypothetical protein